MDQKKVDNSIFYRTTDHAGRDIVFNWIVRRYERNGHVWKKSDGMVWGGALYHVLDYFWMLIFIYFVYVVANFMYDRYGIFKAGMVIVVMILIRFNSLIKKVDQTNRILKERL